MSIQKGHFYLEGYTYINCSDNNSDTVGDIRFRVDFDIDLSDYATI